MKYLAILLLICSLASAQKKPTLTRGYGAPTTGCKTDGAIGNIYVDYAPAGLTYTCNKDVSNVIAWRTLAGGGGGGGGGGTVAFQANNAAVATRDTVNFIGGTGSTVVGTDTGTAVNIQYLPDTAILLTKATAQTDAHKYCLSGGGSTTAFTCALSPALSGYTTGQVFNWRPDATNGASATLNVDALGALPLRKADGTVASAGDAVANQLYSVWNDGTGLRIMGGAVAGSTAAVTEVWCPLGNCGANKNGTLTAATANRTYFWRMYVDKPRVLKRISLPAYPVADTHVYGVYSADGSVLLASCNSVASGVNPGGAGHTCDVGSAVTLAVGEYVVVATTSGTTTGFDCTGGDVSYYLNNLFNAQPAYFPSSRPMFGHGSNVATGSDGAMSLPATLGTLTAVNQCKPHIMFLSN
jgi:hypothetical protein